MLRIQDISNATVALGLEDDPAKWDYLNRGIEYKGEWTRVTRYKVNDVVLYGATLWICTTQHIALLQTQIPTRYITS